MNSAKACTRAAVILSVAFLLIFTSFGGIESLQTSIIPGECKGCEQGVLTGICQSGNVCQDKVKFSCDDTCAAPFEECKSTLGNTILGVVYLAFTLTAFVGPLIPNYFGMKWSMFGASLFYALFAFANLVVALTPNQLGLHTGVMISAAVLLGISASVLWIAQASYLTQLSVLSAGFKNEAVVSSMGFFNGLFFSIFNMSGISGNLISSLVLGFFGWSKTSLFVIYTALGLCGTALLLVLPAKIDKKDQELKEQTEEDKEEDSGASFSLQSLRDVAKDKRMIVLIPVFAFTGLLRGFAMGEFTSNFIRESLGSSSIGYVMAVYGGVNVVASYGFGKLADKFGPLSGQMVGYTVLFVAYCLIYWVPVSKCDAQWFLVMGISILLCLGDASLTTLTSVIVGQEFPSNAVNAFSVFKVYQSGAVAASFFFFKYLTFGSRLIVLKALAVVACASFIVYSKKYRRVTKQNKSLEEPLE